jgi:uncharacterized protein
MAKDLNATPEELVKNKELRKQVNQEKIYLRICGEFTIEDILKELEKPRAEIRGSRLKNFRSMKPLRQWKI